MKSFPTTAEAANMWTANFLLMADAMTVIGLRSVRLMGGGAAAEREAQRMIGEKLAVGFELAGALASGTVRTPAAASRRATALVHRRVRANRRRLG